MARPTAAHRPIARARRPPTQPARRRQRTARQPGARHMEGLLFSNFSDTQIGRRWGIRRAVLIQRESVFELQIQQKIIALGLAALTQLNRPAVRQLILELIALAAGGLRSEERRVGK